MLTCCLLVGVGRTFLTSKVIDHTEEILTRNENDEGLAIFYCKRDEELRRNPVSILHSLVRQLTTSAFSRITLRKPNVQEDIKDLYQKHRIHGSDLTMEVCKSLLLLFTNLYPRTTIILDALDECDKDSRSSILDVIEYIIQESTKPVKVFISSRRDGDIREWLRQNVNIDIQATDNGDDIARFRPRETHPASEVVKDVSGGSETGS